jgi:predicted TIM-barrel fold metal-dependent hydrolase
MSRLFALLCSAACLALFVASGTEGPPRAMPTATTPPPATPALVDEPTTTPSTSPLVKGVPVSRRSRHHGRIIDVHTHVHPAMVEDALALLEARGVERAVNLLPIPYSPRDWELVERMEARAKGRLLHFVSPLWQALLTSPEDFGEQMARNLEAAVRHGARGLKIAKVLGLGAPAPEGGMLAVDDERLAPLWDKAGELGVPVAIHVGDPVAFWEPVTPANERYEELKRNPGWSNVGKDVPSHAALMAQQRRLFARHPKTTFIAVHVAGYPEDLGWVGDLLDALPNVVVDLAARLPALGHHAPADVRRFFERHQDRILFGTDLGVDPGGLMLGAPLATKEGPADVDRFFSASWRYLESTDEDFAHPTPIQGNWRISGLGLSDAVLEKVYRTNAERVLGLRAPAP